MKVDVTTYSTIESRILLPPNTTQSFPFASAKPLFLLEFDTLDDGQLSYSDLPDGPWMPLERPVANTGRHDWLVDFRLPPEIYLKLSVQDLAGNMAEILYDQPVKTVRPPPSGRIRAVRPIEKL